MKLLNLIIYLYSNFMNSKIVYDRAYRILIQPTEVDRAGAASNEIQRYIASQLKSIHPLHYTADDIN